MNTAAQSEDSGFVNIVKWLFVVAIVAAGIYGNYVYGQQEDYFLERVLALVGIGAVAVFVALKTIQGAAFWKLVKESRAEIRRVVWPTREETTQTTFIVVLVVLVMALILWGLDWALNQLVSLVLG